MLQAASHETNWWICMTVWLFSKPSSSVRLILASPSWSSWQLMLHLPFMLSKWSQLPLRYTTKMFLTSPHIFSLTLNYLSCLTSYSYGDSFSLSSHYSTPPRLPYFVKSVLIFCILLPTFSLSPSSFISRYSSGLVMWRTCPSFALPFDNNLHITRTRRLQRAGHVHTSILSAHAHTGGWQSHTVLKLIWEDF